MGYFHALGLAGRARGVHHIGEMLAVHARRRRDGVVGKIHSIDRADPHIRCDRFQPLRERRRRDQQGRPRIAEHVGDARIRRFGIDRQIRSASLERAENRHQQFYRSFEEQPDHAVSADPAPHEVTREAVAALVQLRVADLLRTYTHRDCMRREARLAHELFVDPLGTDIDALQCAYLGQQPLAFLCSHHVRPLQRQRGRRRAPRCAGSSSARRARTPVPRLRAGPDGHAATVRCSARHHPVHS